ncbi:phosphoadenylyl-sulfate reductase [Ekhidna sp. To15]|uniref:phosphoadenylyl-sulfate reductase n=1 Tax=Ekhidna sp. To15 TaxID=3395267 RepID=UPI003F527621
MKSDIKKQLAHLNERYESISQLDRMKRLFSDFDHDRILVTSSFGTTSAIILHMISKVAPNHPVYLINTGYLFEETLEYKEEVKKQLDLNIIEIGAADNKHRFTQENQTWKYQNDLCCFINKVDPTNQLKHGKDVWISGLLRFQNENRRHLRIFESRNELLKFHPIIDMTASEVSSYSTIYELPQNKLYYQGFGSVGCTHCTEKGDQREGRWLNKQKVECGLHV